jgi:hypothetical protein
MNFKAFLLFGAATATSSRQPELRSMPKTPNNFINSPIPRLRFISSEPHSHVDESIYAETMDPFSPRSPYRLIHNELVNYSQPDPAIITEYIELRIKKFNAAFKDVDEAVEALWVFYMYESEYDTLFDILQKHLPMFKDSKMIVEVQQKLKVLKQQGFIGTVGLIKWYEGKIDRSALD